MATARLSDLNAMAFRDGLEVYDSQVAWVGAHP